MIGSCPMHTRVARHPSNHLLQPIRWHKSFEPVDLVRRFTGHRHFMVGGLELEMGVVVRSNIIGDRC